MFKLEQIKVMCEMQDALNSQVNPEWRQQGWDWDTAIKMEASELVGSFQWKHWKSVDSKKADVENAKVEWLDIFHFIISADLEYWDTEKHTLDEDETIESVICNDYNLCLNSKNLEVGKDTLAYAKEFFKLDVRRESMLDYMGTYFLIMKSLGMNANEVYKGYITKNILNQHRQANGYKEGTYKKMWTGPDGEVVEDNVIAFQLAKQFEPDENFANNIMTAIVEYYKVA